MPRSSLLLAGAPFTGKRVLWSLFLSSALRDEVPAVMVTTDEPVSDLRGRLQAVHKDLADHEKEGRIRYVDAYTNAVGIDEALAHVEYVDGPQDLTALAKTLDRAQDAVWGPNGQVLVIDSMTTLMVANGVAESAAFLRGILGRGAAAGATTNVTANLDAHPPQELALMRQLVHNVVELKRDFGSRVLRAEGRGVSHEIDWTEYRHGRTDFELTGSFSANRIR